jgi:hypothetical protein
VGDTPAHDQTVTNHYVLHYPRHEPRENDPNYAAFNAYHKLHESTSICYVGQRLGLDQCADAQGKPMTDQPGHPGLELHHKILEFATLNEVDLAAFALDFRPMTQEQLVAWAETAENFMWLCAKHHRGAGGVHHAAAADWSAELYIRDLIGPFSK